MLLQVTYSKSDDQTLHCDLRFLFSTVVSLCVCMFFRSDFKPTVGIGSASGGVNRTALIIGITVSAVVVVLLTLFAIFYMRRKSRNDDEGKIFF